MRISHFDFYTPEKLFTAWQAVKAKGKSGGIDRVEISDLEPKIQRELESLSQLLIHNQYVPEPAKRVQIPKGMNETRSIALCTILDKVVQTAVKYVLEPVFEPIFCDCSYAYRPGRGHRQAIQKVDFFLHKGYSWFLRADVDNFYDTISHEKLLSFLSERISDSRIIRLIQLWMKMGVIYEGEYLDHEYGIQQGGVISPLLSNIYLHPFDEILTKKRLKMARYGDDFLMAFRTKNDAEKAFEFVSEFLKKTLLLRLNKKEKPVVFVKDGFSFLGIHFQGKNKTVAIYKQEKARNKIKNIIRDFEPASSGETVEKVNENIRSWKYYYSNCQNVDFFKEIDDLVVDELISRFLILREEKRIEDDIFIRSFLKNLKSLQNFNAKTRKKRTKRILTKSKPQITRIGAQKEVKSQQLKDKEIKRLVQKKKRKYQWMLSSKYDLILTEPGIYLGKKGDRVVAKLSGEVIRQIPLKQLQHIVVLSRGVTMSSNLVEACSYHQVPIDFINYQGRAHARLYCPDTPIVDFGFTQIQAFKNGKSFEAAKAFVEGKIKNQLNILKYFSKYRTKVDSEYKKSFSEEKHRIKKYISELADIEFTKDTELFRGRLLALEGRSASSYWKILSRILRGKVVFNGRERQGATDTMNVLLNYGYGILYTRIWGAIQHEGLNPFISYLHAYQKKKPTLVYDMIEEFRAPVVDRVVVALLSKGEISSWDESEFMPKKIRKKLAEEILQRLYLPCHYRGKSKKMAEIIQRQVRALRQFLEGKKPSYQPYLCKW